MADTIIVKNNTGASVFIEDMGTAVPGSGERTFSDFFDFTEICVSEDLKIYINDSTFTINNGTDDLSISDAIEYLDCKNDGGAGGVSYLRDLLDVDLTNLGDNYLLRYDPDTLKFLSGEPKTQTGPNPPDSTTVIWFSSTSRDLYYFDPNVADWISIATNFYEFGRSGNVDGAYLGIGGWSTGGYYYIHHPGVITAIHLSALSGTSTKGFEIRINGNTQYSCNLDNYIFAAHNLSVELTESDYLQLWCTSTDGPVRDVVCQLVYHDKHAIYT